MEPVKLWHWWNAGENAVRPEAHWGLAIDGDYSVPDTFGNQYDYRFEGITAGDDQSMSIWMYNADDTDASLPRHGDPSIQTIDPGGTTPGAYTAPADDTSTIVLDVTGGTAPVTPTIPTELIATAVSETEADVDWQALAEPDLAGFNVYRGTSAGFTPSTTNQIAAAVVESRYADSGLSSDTTYYYKVTATYTNGVETPPSNEASVAMGATSATMAATPAEVVTDKAYWTNKALERAGIDPAKWKHTRGFWTNSTDKRPGNRDIVRKVYDYYQTLYKTDQRLQWAGMARLAGGPVVRGLTLIGDAQLVLAFNFDYLKAQLDYDAFWLGKAVNTVAGGIVALEHITGNFLLMQKEIFYDLAWQHEAFLSGGVAELRARRDAGELTEQNYQAWVNIGSGNNGQMWDGNTELLRREQQEVLARGYAYLKRIPGVDNGMALNVENPIPGGGPYPYTSLCDFPARWQWIQDEMLAPWMARPEAERYFFIDRTYNELIASVE